MRELRMEQIEYAVARLVQLIEFRGMKQIVLEESSGVAQSTISKILSRSQEHAGERYTPTEEVLKRLFHALGLKLTDILNEPDCLPDEILGYLATPLTALSPDSDNELKRVVDKVRALAAEKQFQSPPFNIYWPGDYTHPRRHAEISAKQVYVTDRSRASSYDFIILFCGAASYGLGQENEIATQAGIPAVRLIPQNGMSRMMLGSFVRAIDLKFSGSLDTHITFGESELKSALTEIRKIYFRHRALHRGLNRDGFGGRLRRLVNERCDDYMQFSNDVGISLDYLHNLMEEPFTVSNPSARLLGRIAARLGERVAYLLGEAEESDPVWIESNASWRQWFEKTPDVDPRLAFEIRDQWHNNYRTALRDHQSSSASFRNSARLMKDIDWDKEYQKRAKSQRGKSPDQRNLV